jgi:hypothetical protein
MAPEQRLGPYSAPRRERCREDQIQVARGAASCAGSVIGTPDLSQDFSFAEDLRIESRRDTK